MEGLKAALETTKQVIALSTGVITLTVTFLEKIVQPQAGTQRHVPAVLQCGWISLGFAVAFALWTLMAITGTMNSVDREARQLVLNSVQKKAVQDLADGKNIKLPAMAMLIFFAIGIGLVILSGFYL